MERSFVYRNVILVMSAITSIGVIYFLARGLFLLAFVLLIAGMVSMGSALWMCAREVAKERRKGRSKHD